MKNSYLVSAFGSYLLFRKLLVFPLVLLTMLVQARVNFTDTYTQNFNTLAATGASNTWMNDVAIFSYDMDATDRGLGGLGSDGTYFAPAGAAVAGWIAVAFANNITITIIASNQNPSLTNTNVTFTATVTSGGNPVTLGTVTFTKGATVLAANVPLNASGQASFSTDDLTEGSHIITAAYSGATGFLGSSGSVTQVVNNPTSVNGNTFCNDLSGITINDNAPATPYPSNIFVSGLSGPITSITVDLKDLTHTVPDDIDLLLVGPGGQTFVLMSGVGGANSVNNVNITFSDPAAIALPDNASVASGTYRPAVYESMNTFPAPAPAGANNTPAPIGTATLASVFNGIDPNGTWRLFAVDDAGTNSGNIAGGWCLNITIENPCTATDLRAWTGAVSTDWHTDGNWDPACVPTASDDVNIPNVTNDPVVMAGTAAVAKSVTINADAALTVEATGSLTIEGATGFPSGGMLNQGAVTNNGTLLIGPNISPGQYGVVNEGTFDNNTGAETRIDRTSNMGFWNKMAAASLTNAGTIVIGETAASNTSGVFNEGTVQNDGGEIRIDRFNGAGIHNQANSTVTNSGRIIIGKIATSFGAGIYNFGHIANLPAGEIEVDRTSSGIYNTTANTTDNSSFVNEGKIAVGQTTSVSGPGIYNYTSFIGTVPMVTFENKTGGEILIDRSFNGIHNDQRCWFDNFGLIEIATKATWTGFNPGIYNRSKFNNTADGEIRMDSLFQTGLHHLADTFTNAGKIIIGITALNTNFYPGVYNEATFLNEEDAEVHVDRYQHVGFQNAFGSTLLKNAGLIRIGENVAGGRNGLFNYGVVDNLATGEIYVDHIDTTINSNGVYHASGTFTNAGKILIGSIGDAGATGLYNRSTFINSGEISIDSVKSLYNDRHGLYHASGGTFTNTGKITLGATDSIGKFGIFSVAAFNNNAGGEISIDRCSITGLRNGSFGFGGTFTNHGKLNIGANAGVGSWGLWNDSPFNNSGELSVDNATVTGLRHQSNTFTNTGSIALGGIANIGDWGLWNQATFNNNAGGEIEIDRTANTGLLNFGSTFTNNGIITIGAETAVGDQAIYNQSTLNNSACAQLHIFAPLNNTSSLTNSGLFLVNTDEAHTNSGLTNNGVIGYAQDNPIPNVTNNEIIIAPVTSSQCAEISPAFELGGTLDLTVSGIFTDEAATNPAGTFESATNTFSADPVLEVGVRDLFVQVEDPLGMCAYIVPWELTTENCIAISGKIQWSTNLNQGVKDATVTITGDATGSDMSDATGDYWVALSTGGNLTVTPTKNINKFNGVTAADATRIQQHITGSSPLGAPFPRIAADVNKSNSITTADAGLITQALLGNPTANNLWNTSWRFVDADYVFPNPNAPWNFPESVSLSGVDAAVTDIDFIGIKLGDVASPTANPQLRPQPMVLRAQDRRLQAGETVRLDVAVEGYDDIAAFQFVLRFHPGALRLEGVDTPAGGTLKAG